VNERGPFRVKRVSATEWAVVNRAGDVELQGYRSPREAGTMRDVMNQAMRDVDGQEQQAQ
jgi:hypothetical protein